MGVIDRLGNLAKGTVKVQQQAWDDSGGLEGQLERLRTGASQLAQSAEAAVREARSPDPSEAPVKSTEARSSTLPDPPGPVDALAAELARLELAFTEGRMTRSELRRKQAEAHARLGGSGRRTL